MLVRYYSVINQFKFNFTSVPMKHFFTLETSSPSEKTISIIKQIAYCFPISACCGFFAS